MFKYTRFALVTLLAVSVAAYADDKSGKDANPPKEETKSYVSQATDAICGAGAAVVAAAVVSKDFVVKWAWRAGYTPAELEKTSWLQYSGVWAVRAFSSAVAAYGAYLAYDAYCDGNCPKNRVVKRTQVA